MLKQLLEQAIRDNNLEQAASIGRQITATYNQAYYKHCLNHIGKKLAEEYYQEQDSQLYSQVDINPLAIFA